MAKSGRRSFPEAIVNPYRASLDSLLKTLERLNILILFDISLRWTFFFFFTLQTHLCLKNSFELNVDEGKVTNSS